MNDSSKHDDTDLTAYLDGRDGVSATYKSIGGDEPPAALDRAILQAARAAALPGQPAVRRTDRRKLYSLAASVMVAVGVLAVYVGQRDLPAAPQSTPVPLTDSQRSELSNKDQPTAPPASVPTGFKQRQVKEDIVVSASAVTADTGNKPTLPITRAAETAPTAPAAPAPVPAAAAARASAEPQKSSTVIFAGDQLEKIEAQDLKRTQQQSAQAGQLEETVVTGSRIVRSNAAEVPYRNTVDTWLGKIRSLTDELKQLEANGEQRSAHAREVADQLRDERALFAQRNPAVNLDAALKAQR